MAKLGPVKFLTIHCAATPEGRSVSAAQITEWDKARFGQTSYHWVIEIDGSMHRTLRDDEKGAHVGKANTGNIGICYVGGVETNGKTPKDTRTDQQKKAMLTLVRTYKERYPGIIIRGHRDWSPDLNRDGKITPNEWIKFCPCFDVSGWLKETGD
jgi:N-acetyl-anhydromuramyl-L-alanine amidase AmpD